MSTISISRKEYDALVFAKNAKKPNANKMSFNDAAFGIFNKTKTNSVALVNRLRKYWR